MKKTFFLLLVFSGVFGFIGCVCNDVPKHWNATDLEITFSDGNRIALDSLNYTRDTLHLVIDMAPEYVEPGHFNGGFFLNPMYATSCEEEGSKGMDDELVKITIESSLDYDSIAAGEPLNDLFKTIYGTATVDEWLERMVDALPPGWSPDLSDFMITEKPIEEGAQTFTIKLEFDSGKEMESTSPEILWN